MLTVDLSHLPGAVREQLHAHYARENETALQQAVARQEHIAAHYARNPPRSLEGIGGQTMAVDPYFQKYFRLQYGDDAWEDPAKRAFILKQNPELRVKHGRTDPTRGGDAVSPRGRRVFHKSYG